MTILAFLVSSPTEIYGPRSLINAMTLTLYQVDSFTNTPFSGNPAGVCILTEPADESWMQDVAREMNLSETAFLYPENDGYHLRWFTPAVEVDLCGHATLASAHILWETGVLTPDQPARFYTRSGLLTCEKRGDWIEMDFPARPPEPVAPPPGLLGALGAESLFVGRNVDDYLVEVATEAEVHALNPDFGLLNTVSARGAIVTSRSTSSAQDFISRFFAPAAGVNEDPVTGSAHTSLGPYWADRLGKSEMVGYQASARGGIVRVQISGEGRVLLSGQAVTVLKCDLLV